MATHQLTISLLGPFQATRDGQPVTRFGSDTARALLAYLVMHPGVAHRRDALAGLLWPEQPNATALRNLRVALNRLRSALGDRDAETPLLDVTRQTIQCTTSATWQLDVQAMRDALDAVKNHNHADGETCEACAGHLHAVAGLYRGDFLAGFALDSPQFEEWMVVERENCHWRALEALSTLTAYHEKHHNYEATIECARRQVELEPWRESAHRQWMRALALSGQRGAALTQFDTCRAVLASELGVEPEAETLDLVEQIRSGTLSPAAPGPSAAATGPTAAAQHDVARAPAAVAPAFPEGERRIVTVVQAAFGNPETLLARTNAEERAAITSQVLLAAGAEIHRYGGYVDRYDENGLTAFFGAQAAHEDDPERAVLAALAMQQVLEAQVSGRTSRPAELSVRAAVHTGEVIVTAVEGNGSPDRHTVIGDAVLATGRLLAQIPPGAVQVSAATYHLVEPLFEWSLHGGYTPLAHKRPADKGRGVPGMYADLVGRDRELHALNAAVARLQSGIGGIVTLTGDAGIGKSRLVAEARDLADARWVEGRCLSYTGTMAYVLWQDVLRSMLGAAVDTPPAVINHALREHVRALDPEHFASTYAYLGRLLGLPLDAEAEALVARMEGASLQNATFFAVERFVERAAQRQPLVIVCEDLHWADPTSLALLEYLLPLTDRVPLLLVGVFRPQREHGCWRIRETALRAYPHRHTDVQLQPLSAADGETLIEHLLLSLPGPGGRTPVEGLPETFKARILDHSEGNPFYIEEILRALIHDGVIVCEAVTCRWEADEEMVDIGIPETLYGVLRSRIDQLPSGARHLLHLASVVGRIFPKRLLAAIAERDGLDANLVTLQREQLIRERARLPEAEYIFQHQLTLEAAYGGLLQRVRRTLHRRVAVAIEQLYPERIDEQLGVLAQHWEQAGDTVRAVAYLRRAGEQAAAQYANREAIEYFSRALDLLPDTDLKGQYDVLLKRVTVYDLTGMRDAQRADLRRLQELAAALDDGETASQRRQAEVAVQLTDLYEHTVDHDGLADAAHDIIQMARAAGDVTLEAKGHSAHGSALDAAGDVEGAHQQMLQALALARQAGDQQAEASILRKLGISQHIPWEQARAYLEENIRIQKEIGNRAEEGSALNALGYGYSFVHKPASALAYSIEGTQLCQMTGLRREEAWGHLSMAWSYLDLGRLEEADDRAQQAIAIFRQVNDLGGESAATIARSWVAQATGNQDASQKYAEEAIRLADVVNAGAPSVGSRVTLGKILLEKQCWTKAAQVFNDGLEKSERLKNTNGIIHARSGLAQIALAQDNPAQALTHINEVVQAMARDPILQGIARPGHIYLTCYRVLHALDDPRAEAILAQGHRLLQGWAAEIEDEVLRRSYLENVPENRELVAAFEAMNAPTPAAARRLAEVALHEAHYLGVIQNYAAQADAAQRAVDMAQFAGDPGIEAESWMRSGFARFYHESDPESAEDHWKRAVTIARETGDRHLEAQILREIGVAFNNIGRIDDAISYFKQTLRICTGLGDVWGEGRAQNTLGMLALEAHHLTAAIDHLENGLRLCRTTGNRYDEAWSLQSLGTTLCRLGHYIAGDDNLRAAYERFHQVEDPWGESAAMCARGRCAYFAGNAVESQAYVEQALRRAVAIDAPSIQAAGWMTLGDIQADNAQWTDATEAYHKAFAACQKSMWPHRTPNVQARLAQAALSQHAISVAQTRIESVLSYLDSHPDLPGSDDPMRVYLICYRVLNALDDPRAEAILAQGHRLLQGWAAEIEDEALRRSFLENVPENREIIAEHPPVQHR